MQSHDSEDEAELSVQKTQIQKPAAQPNFFGEFLKLQKNTQISQNQRPEEYNFYVHDQKFHFGVDSWYLFKESYQIRKYCVWLVTWHLFDKVITAIILLNTISLTLQNYDFRLNQNQQQSDFAIVSGYFEYFFTSVFITEFILKSIAMGFIMEPNTYLRDAWNVLDFCVVLSSILGLIGSFNLSAIRTVRILRPLRSIKQIPGLRILVSSLLDSLPNLANVVIFLLYLIIIFGILGMQLFSGDFENRCRITQFPVNGVWKADDNFTNLCSQDSDCPTGLYCGNPATYDLPFQDKLIPELEYDFVTFDNMPLATYTIFQALTGEGWSLTATQLSHTNSPFFVYPYFILLILLGTFFTMNLILAVINDQFLKNTSLRKQELFKEEQTRRILKREKRMKEKQQAKIHPTTNNVVITEDSDESDEEIKKKKEEFIKSVLKPAIYVGRAQYLKQLQDEQNKKLREREHVNYFDPMFYTLVKEAENSGDFAQQIKSKISNFVESQYFAIFINLIILANTAVLAMDRYPQPLDEYYILLYMSLTFSCLFLIEMLMKLYAMGFREYFRDRMNSFDAFIILVSLAEQIMDVQDVNVSGNSFKVVTAFRTFRIFRVFKLARAWTSFRDILIAIISTFDSIAYFSVLLILYMVVSSLIGMELFAYYIPNSRLNFDTFPNAMVTIFTFLTKEKWNFLSNYYMYQQDNYWPAIYFTLVLVLGNLILLKLFVAILIYNFGQSAIEAEKRLQEKTMKTTIQILMDKMKNSNRLNSQGNEQVSERKIEKKKRKPNLNYIGQDGNSDVALFFVAKYDEARFEARKERVQKKIMERFFLTSEIIKPEDISDDSEDEEIERKLKEKLNTDNNPQLSRRSSLSRRGSLILSRKTSIFSSEAPSDLIDNILLKGSSLFIFEQTSKFRRLCYRFVNHPLFLILSTFMILLSSVILALDDPLVSTPNSILKQLDLIVTIVFLIECIAKIIAYGFIINGEGSYLRDLANVLDFIVVGFSVADQFTSQKLSFFKVLRIVRVLRPLRLIARSESLKVAINSIVLSIPKLLNLMLVSLLFFFMFGISGVNFFKGSFYYCDIQTNVNTKQDCFDYGGNWMNQDYNFDNSINAMIQLFVMSTTEGWIGLMWQGVDHVGIDSQPVQDFNLFWVIYYIMFMIVGSFFMMNLFAGVVLDAFNSEKSKLKGYFYLTTEQQEWVDIQERIFNSKPQVYFQLSENKFRLKAQKIINHQYFDKFIFTMICVNTLIFMIQYNRQPKELTQFISYANLFFLAVFGIEMIIKVVGLGKAYFTDKYNKFDFTVVILTLITTLFEQLNLFTSVGTAISVLRSFRIIRVMRLIRQARSLRIIFETFIITLPELVSIIALLGIVIFMYGVLGYNLYPYLKRGDGINSDYNFSSLLGSLFILFRTSTGENWNVVQADTARGLQPDNPCQNVNTADEYIQLGFEGCGNISGYFYFSSFYLLFSMILLDLFIAVIIQGYDKTQKDDSSLVSSSHIEIYIERWKYEDRDAEGLISADRIIQFLTNLPKPLGWQNMILREEDKRKYISDFKLPIYIKEEKPYYNYYEVLQILSHDLLQRKFGEETEYFIYIFLRLEPKKQVQVTKDLIKQKLRLINSISNANSSVFTSRDYQAIRIIVEYLKKRVQISKGKQITNENRIEKISEIVSENSDDENDNEQRQTKFNTLNSAHPLRTQNRFQR